MEQVTCPQCRAGNDAAAAFCGRCGAALATQHPAAAPSGWDLATAGMDQAPAPDGRLLARGDYAGWWQRLGGALLDGVLLMLVVAALGGAVAAAWWASDPSAFTAYFREVARDRPGFDEADQVGVAVVTWYMLVAAAWEIGWVRSRWMAKPGQAVVGFRVVQAEPPARVGTGRAAARFVARALLSGVGGGIATLASAFTIALSERRQALHDLVAGTACVRTQALRARGIGPVTGSGAAPAAASADPPPPAPPASAPAERDGRAGPFR